MKIEVVMLPVTDIEASIKFYERTLGFHLDHDVQPAEGMRVVQLTPPGSGCSVVFGTGIGELAAPGSVKNTHLVVEDIQEAVEALKANGLEISDITDMGGVKYAFFADPSGNTWSLQEKYKQR